MKELHSSDLNVVNNGTNISSIFIFCGWKSFKNHGIIPEKQREKARTKKLKLFDWVFQHLAEKETWIIIMGRSNLKVMQHKHYVKQNSRGYGLK